MAVILKNSLEILPSFLPEKIHLIFPGPRQKTYPFSAFEKSRKTAIFERRCLQHVSAHVSKLRFAHDARFGYKTLCQKK
jgi:hypothetical protein